MAIKIVTDSSCDLPQDVADSLGITIVSLSIRFGDDEFIDRVNITPSEFWQRCAESPVLPQTAAPSPGDFEKAYRSLIAGGATGILVVSLSRDLSATMDSAEIGARALADSGVPIEIVDSRTASMGLGLMAMECARMAAGGATLGAVRDAARDMTGRTRIFGALDTIENLKKGGRIGGAKALMATALAIKPLIEIRDGVVAEGGKQRTRGKALAWLIDKVREHPEIECLGVLHAQCDDVDQFVDELRKVYGGDIVVGNIGAVIGTHAGKGTIGVAFRTSR